MAVPLLVMLPACILELLVLVERELREDLLRVQVADESILLGSE
jgi:hypothetical protein